MKFKVVANDYLSLYAKNKLKLSTMQDYEYKMKKYLIPHFGDMEIAKINTRVLSNYFCNNLQMKAQSIKQCFTVMESIMKFAKSQNYIKSNPCRDVILPRIDYISKDTPEIDLLKYFVGYSQLNVIVKTILFTGIRSGEARALKWNDVNFDTGAINVRNNISHVHGKYIITTPKTKNSIRVVYMNEDLKRILLEHKSKQIKSNLNLVFTNQEGGFLNSSSLWFSYKERLKDTKYANTTIHTLRHMAATILLNNGADIKLVSDYLGHANITTTARIYAEITDKSRERLASIMSDSVKLL